MMYLLTSGVTLLVLGMGLSAYNKHAMKKERDLTDRQRHTQALTRIFMLVGSVITLISGISVISDYVSTQKAIEAAKPVVELKKDTVSIEKGAATVTLNVSANAGIKIKSDNKNVDDVIIKAEDLAQDVTVNFVVPGTYEVEGKRSGKTEKHELTILPEVVAEVDMPEQSTTPDVAVTEETPSADAPTEEMPSEEVTEN